MELPNGRAGGEGRVLLLPGLFLCWWLRRFSELLLLTRGLLIGAGLDRETLTMLLRELRSALSE